MSDDGRDAAVVAEGLRKRFGTTEALSGPLAVRRYRRAV